VFKKIIIVVLIVGVVILGYRMMSPKVDTRVVYEKAEPDVISFPVYAANVNKGELLKVADTKDETLKKGEKYRGQRMVTAVKIPFDQNPIMRTEKLRGEVVTRGDFALPNDSDYYALLQGSHYIAFSVNVAQKGLDKYVHVGSQVNVLAFASINNNLSAKDSVAKLKATKDKLALSLLLKNIKVLSVSSKGDGTFDVSLSIPQDKLAKMLEATKTSTINLMLAGDKSSNEKIAGYLTNEGFNNVREYRGEADND